MARRRNTPGGAPQGSAAPAPTQKYTATKPQVKRYVFTNDLPAVLLRDFTARAASLTRRARGHRLVDRRRDVTTNTTTDEHDDRRTRRRDGRHRRRRRPTRRRTGTGDGHKIEVASRHAVGRRHDPSRQDGALRGRRDRGYPRTPLPISAPLPPPPDAPSSAHGHHLRVQNARPHPKTPPW